MREKVLYSSLWARLKGRWMLVLFAMPFAGVGLGFLIISIMPALSEWQSMKSWQYGSAFIQSAELSVSYGDSTTYKAKAEYAYEYQGREYTNNKVGITAGHDNIGNYHKNMSRRLKRAASNKTPVNLWIDPANPQNSVLDRNIRWELLLFKMVFVLVFGSVGFGILAFVLLAPSDKLKNSDSVSKPWLSRREWASKTIISNAKSGVYFIWIFTFFWNAISFPIAFFAMKDYSSENLKVLVVLLFPLVGLGLIAVGIKQVRAWRFFGKTPFIMDPYPGVIGGQVGGTIDLNIPYTAKTAFKVTLNCLRSYVTGSGKHRKHHESLVWQSQGFAYTRSWGDKTRLSLLFDVDNNLPVSEPSSNSYHFWQLQVEAAMPGVDFNRAYTVPVFKLETQSAGRARHLDELCVNHPEAETYREQEIESILNIEQIPDGIVLYYPAFKQMGGKLVVLIVGLIFFAVGVGISLSGKAVFISAVFSLVGLPLALSGFYFLSVSLNVRIDKNKLETIKRIFGIRVGGQSVSRKVVRHLCLKESYTSSGNGTHTKFYKIQAEMLNNKKIVVGYNLAGKNIAQQALEAFSLLTAIPIKRE